MALRPSTQVAVIGAGVIGLVLVVSGLMWIVNGSLMFLFGLTTVVTGAVSITLAAFAWQGKRAAWAFLLALTGVFALNAFFAAPKVVSLPRLRHVTAEPEQKIGREKAEDRVDAENLRIRFMNLGVCLLFAAPFIATCVGLAKAGPDFERRV